MGLNSADPLICGFFSILQYYMVRGWLNPWIQNSEYKGWTVKLYLDFLLRGFSDPNPCFVQGSSAFEILFNTRASNLGFGNLLQPLFSEHAAYIKLREEGGERKCFCHSFVVDFFTDISYVLPISASMRPLLLILS